MLYENETYFWAQDHDWMERLKDLCYRGTDPDWAEFDETLLVYADFLDDKGESDRADWVRHHIKNHGQAVVDPRVGSDLFFSYEHGESWWSGSKEEGHCWEDQR